MKITSHRDASKRLTLSIYDYRCEKYSELKQNLKNKFNLKDKTQTITGFDEVFQELFNKDGQVSIDWDIWGGFLVTALNRESEPLVNKIKEYLLLIL